MDLFCFWIYVFICLEGIGNKGVRWAPAQLANTLYADKEIRKELLNGKLHKLSFV